MVKETEDSIEMAKNSFCGAQGAECSDIAKAADHMANWYDIEGYFSRGQVFNEESMISW